MKLERFLFDLTGSLSSQRRRSYLKRNAPPKSNVARYHKAWCRVKTRAPPLAKKTASLIEKEPLKKRISNPPEAGGVEVAFALPVSSISVFKIRPDLWLHRKIVVIDDTAAYTSSFNLVDPRFFKNYKTAV